MLVVDAVTGMTGADEELVHLFEEKEIPYVIALNKSDLCAVCSFDADDPHIWVSAKAVSYTHLDVYKRQTVKGIFLSPDS